MFSMLSLKMCKQPCCNKARSLGLFIVVLGLYILYTLSYIGVHKNILPKDALRMPHMDMDDETEEPSIYNIRANDRLSKRKSTLPEYHLTQHISITSTIYSVKIVRSAPKIEPSTTLEDGKLIIDFTAPTTNTVSHDPIIAYKVRFWALKNVTSEDSVSEYPKTEDEIDEALRGVDYTELVIILKDKDQSKIVIHDLTRYTFYKIALMAMYDNGDGPPAVSIIENNEHKVYKNPTQIIKSTTLRKRTTTTATIPTTSPSPSTTTTTITTPTSPPPTTRVVMTSTTVPTTPYRPAPIILLSTTLENGKLRLEFAKPSVLLNLDDPIIGYKVRTWPLNNVTRSGKTHYPITKDEMEIGLRDVKFKESLVSILDSENGVIVIEGLQRYSYYKVSLMAMYQSGDGPQATSIIENNDYEVSPQPTKATTAQHKHNADPLSRPLPIIYPSTVIENGKLKLEYTEPSPEEQRIEPVLGYKVRLWPMRNVTSAGKKSDYPRSEEEMEAALDGVQYKEVVVNLGDSENGLIVIDGLDRYTFYKIGLIAMYESGDGPIATSIIENDEIEVIALTTMTTLSTTVSSRQIRTSPAIRTTSTISNGKLRLEYSKPSSYVNSDDPIIAYKVRLWPLKNVTGPGEVSTYPLTEDDLEEALKGVDFTELLVSLSDSDNGYIMLDGLARFTYYKIALLAVYDNGDGPAASLVIESRDFETVPPVLKKPVTSRMTLPTYKPITTTTVSSTISTTLDLLPIRELPIIQSTTSLENGQLALEFSLPISNNVVDDPIIGYKLRLWPLRNVTGPSGESEYPKTMDEMRNALKGVKYKELIISLKEGENNIINVGGLNRYTFYKIGFLAMHESGDGPLATAIIQNDEIEVITTPRTTTPAPTTQTTTTTPKLITTRTTPVTTTTYSPIPTSPLLIRLPPTIRHTSMIENGKLRLEFLNPRNDGVDYDPIIGYTPRSQEELHNSLLGVSSNDYIVSLKESINGVINLDGLQRYTMYKVALFAMYESGDGPAAVTIIENNEHDGEPFRYVHGNNELHTSVIRSPPTIQPSTTLENGKLKLEFAEPSTKLKLNKEDTILGYKIRLWPMKNTTGPYNTTYYPRTGEELEKALEGIEHKDLFVQLKDVENNVISIEGLQRYTFYKVALVAMYNDGDGPAASSIIENDETEYEQPMVALPTERTEMIESSVSTEPPIVLEPAMSTERIEKLHQHASIEPIVQLEMPIPSTNPTKQISEHREPEDVTKAATAMAIGNVESAGRARSGRSPPIIHPSTTIDNGKLKLDYTDPIPGRNDADPLIGYKVRLWPMRNVTGPGNLSDYPHTAEELESSLQGVDYNEHIVTLRQSENGEIVIDGLQLYTLYKIALIPMYEVGDGPPATLTIEYDGPIIHESLHTTPMTTVVPFDGDLTTYQFLYY